LGLFTLLPIPLTTESTLVKNLHSLNAVGNLLKEEQTNVGTQLKVIGKTIMVVVMSFQQM